MLNDMKIMNQIGISTMKFTVTWLTCNTLVHRKQHVNYDNNLRGKIISHKKLYSEVTNLT